MIFSAKSRITSRRAPEAVRKALRLIVTSSGFRSPAGNMSLERLYNKCLDPKHEGDEGQRVGQQQFQVETLESRIDLEADAVRAAESLDDEDDLPDQRQAGAGRSRNIGCELRQ